MPRLVLDTDTFSEVLRGVNTAVVRHATDHLRSYGTLTITAITVMEVVRGVLHAGPTHRARTILGWLARAEVLGVDRTTAESAGVLLADLEQAGTPIGLPGTMIAAIALEHGLDLMTGNARHFAQVQHLGHPLNLVDWQN